jgi:hypothetical protein
MSEIRKWQEEIGVANMPMPLRPMKSVVDDQMLKDIGISIDGHRLRTPECGRKIAPYLRMRPPRRRPGAAS